MKEVNNDRAERESLINSIMEMHFRQTKWSESMGLTASANQAAQQTLTLERELRTKPLDELKFLYEQAVANRSQAEDGEDGQEIEDDEDEAFFNDSRTIADFTFWARADSWKLEEAVALCLGWDPKDVMSRTLEPWHKRSIAQFERNLDLARRAQHAKALQEDVCPKSFLDWADRKGIEYPAALREAVSAHQHDKTRSDGHAETAQEVAVLLEKIQKLEDELDEANKKPKPTFYRIVYLLAAARKKSKTLTDDDIPETVNFIRQRAFVSGFKTLDDESVRGCLREASAHCLSKLPGKNSE